MTPDGKVQPIAAPRKRKTNHKKGILAADRARKRAEAEARQAYAAALTPAQRLERLDLMGHGAGRERARLAQEVLPFEVTSCA